MINPKATDMLLYILDGHTPVPTDDLWTWARAFENHAARVVANTKVGDVTVSTVFLGLNHQFGRGVPLLFETMIFGGPQDNYCMRWPTWAEAEAGHAATVRLLTGDE
jgi:hypothetical protein